MTNEKIAPKTIKSIDDAAMFSFWLTDNYEPMVNGIQIGYVMNGKQTENGWERIDRVTWIYQNRRICNDWIRSQQ